MRGKPKYKYGDIVSFKWNDEVKEGTVYIVDAYGTFFEPDDVSYDILIEEENTLYKHITETLLIENE